MNRTPSNLPQDVLTRVRHAEARSDAWVGLHCAAPARIFSGPDAEIGPKRVFAGGAHA